MTEHQMVSKVSRVLSKKAGIVAKNVPFLSRCIDLVLIHDDCVVAIEFKLSNWRKAIIQAKDHRIGADLAYICLPPRKVSDSLRESLVREGIGLYFFKKGAGFPLVEILKPRRKPQRMEIYRQWLIKAAAGR